MKYEFIINGQSYKVIGDGKEYVITTLAKPIGIISPEIDVKSGLKWISKEIIDVELLKELGKRIEDADM